MSTAQQLQDFLSIASHSEENNGSSCGGFGGYGRMIPLRSQAGCGTSALEQELGIGIWANPTAKDVLLEIMAEELGGYLSAFDPPDRDQILDYLFERTGWAPESYDPENPLLREILRSMVRGLQSVDALTDYILEWCESRARGW